MTDRYTAEARALMHSPHCMGSLTGSHAVYCAANDEEAIARVAARLRELGEALAPFALYARQREAMPLRGLGDLIHAIHTGSEWEAEITLDHVNAARAALAHYESRVVGPLRDQLALADFAADVAKVKASVTPDWASVKAAFGRHGMPFDAACVETLMEQVHAGNVAAGKLAGAQMELAALKSNSDHWRVCAARHCRNEDYYRGLVVQIGEHLGDESYIADDGTRSEEVLCAKVPELVAARLKARPAESGERQKWAWIVRHYVSGLTGRERERIATLLESPAREGES